ncbi:nuclear transport factor 2 family protein [Amycolatopsis silviterrae]|uniref:Nuclear transport factor 2 family protein n=1 Tax=Amycolatopsis silviterrae TaxID=1656914 RepID=A0ABW5HE66_9PSEU
MATTVGMQLYQEVQAFYAKQMQLMDDGEVEPWAQTFTSDATIANNANPAPASGRELILKVARKLAADVESRGVQHRHWTGMLVVDSESADRVRTQLYAMVAEIPAGGEARLWRSTFCRDTLVRGVDGWQVSRRVVTHDDIQDVDVEESA